MIYKIPLDIIKNMMKIDDVFTFRINSYVEQTAAILHRKLKKIEPKKQCSFSNYGKRLDFTLGKKQVLRRINFMGEKVMKRSSPGQVWK